MNTLLCPWHKPGQRSYIAGQRSYIGFFIHGDKMVAKGVKQKQCPDCKRWFWPSEYGVKPKEKICDSEYLQKLIDAAADEHYNSSMDSPSEALLVAEIEKREAAWKNLAMLYRRKIARYRNQIVQLGEAPKADEKIDGGIERFEKQLDCAPNIVRLGGGDGLMGGASD